MTNSKDEVNDRKIEAHKLDAEKISQSEKFNIGENWGVIGPSYFLEQQIPALKFNGPGWYYYDGDTILIVAIERPDDPLCDDTPFTWKAGEYFRAYLWKGYDPQPLMFAAAHNGPVRRRVTHR